MIVVRAWPGRPPAGRARVEGDGWPRVAVDDYDYRGLEGLGEDVISLDWDTAIDLEDLRRFAAHAAEDPARVLYGPCKVYVSPEGPWWAAKVYLPGEQQMRYVQPGDPFCHLFGFGMIYLPHALITAFTAANPGAVMDDISFSGWHYRHVTREVPIDWSVRPVHLHYDVPPGGRL